MKSFTVKFGKILLGLVFILSACSRGLSESEMQNIVAQTVNASLPQGDDTQPTATRYPSPEPLPTYTPYPTYTAYPTYTPYPVEEAEPVEPPTSTPTIAPEIGAGIADVVPCGEYFSVKVLEPPTDRKSVVTTIEQNIYEEKPTGEFVFVKIELVNESGETWGRFFVDEFYMIAKVDEESLTYRAEFEATNYINRNFEYANYLPAYYEESQPEVPFKTIIGFDVSPYAEERVFVFRPKLGDTTQVACEVHIPLE